MRNNPRQTSHVQGALPACGRSPRRRGSTYVMVIGASMTLTVIGMSAVTLSRIKTSSTVQSNDFTSSRLLTFSGAEHALAKINSDPDWRNTYNGVIVTKTIGSGTFSWRVIDEGDGDLTDNLTDQATLIVTASDGATSYSQSITLSAAAGSPSDEAMATLWGVDDDDGEIFSISDYEDPINTMTRYGRLKYDRNGDLRNVGDDIEAMAIDTDGTAYMVCQDDVWNYDKPVLLKFNINNASTTEDNVVEIIGEINWSRNITGLAFDPDTGDLYALGEAGGHGTADHLILINKDTAAVTSDIGAMSGGGRIIGEGQDMVFDGNGQLYVTDDYDDVSVLYKVNKTDGTITQVVDDWMSSSGTFEAIAWDSVNGCFLAIRESSARLYRITNQTGNNVYLGRLRNGGINDCEAMGFLPANAGTGSTNVGPVQSPSATKRIVN